MNSKDQSLRIHLAYALGMLKAAGIDPPTWLEEAAFDSD